MLDRAGFWDPAKRGRGVEPLCCCRPERHRGGWLGRPPESPDAGACRTCIPRRSGLDNGIRFFLGGFFFLGVQRNSIWADYLDMHLRVF